MNEDRIRDSAKDLAQELGSPVPKKRRQISGKQIERIREEAAEMRMTKDWSGARPGHLVALWAWCHTQIYKVSPEEVRSPATFGMACIRAGQLVRNSFAGSPMQAVDFIRWTWTRENKRLSKSEGDVTRRIDWSLQFSASMVTDYRVATAGRHVI